ncbi:MAG: hypothetical protein PHT40_02455 [Patescibacteria group bacterium]|nr:hypothetical protein [Patescibacteria group bacterium]
MKIRFFGVILIFLATILAPVAPALAQFTFNPHYVLSDQELTNYSSMTIDQINAFLKSKGGILANYIDPNVRMSIPQLIYESSQMYKINPRYALVLLQKEQSLITDEAPTQGQLNWATGYGCPDSGGCNPKYQGLGNQIDWGVGAIRFYLDNPNQFRFQTGRTYTVDGQSVTMQNDATTALYIYTPHLHGNESLARIWTEWFSQNYPDGSLLQDNEDGSVWLIQGNSRRLFSSKVALVSRYSTKQLIPVEPNELEKYQIGTPIKYANYSLLRIETGGIYLLDNDVVRPITSMKAFKLLGFNPEEVMNVKTTDIADIPRGESITIESTFPTGGLLQDKATGGVYFVQNGKKYPIWAKQLLNLYYKTKKIVKVTAEELKQYPTGNPIKFKDGELLKSDKESTIYFVSNGARRPFVSEAAFKELGYKLTNVIVTTDKLLSLHPIGEVITSANFVSASSTK